MRLVKATGLSMLAAASLFWAATAAAAAEKLKVVTTFTVIADMARNVAGDAAEVVSITKPGAEIHGYEPTPQDIVRASGAGLILWNGLNLERWFEQFVANLGDIPSATVTEGVEQIAISEGDYSGKANPHAWMSLSNAMIYVDNIRDALSRHDPANADAYAKNAEAYKRSIRETIGPLRERIARIPEDKRWLVTCEGAFSYLARDFGMKELYLWPINADQIGTPQEIYDRPATMFVANFIGSPPMNFLHFEATLEPGAGNVRLSGIEVPVPRIADGVTGRKLVLGVRPEHVILADEGLFRGEVSATEYLGTTQIITLKTPNGVVKARAPSSQTARIGETSALSFNTSTLSLFDAGSGQALKVGRTLPTGMEEAGNG